MRRNPVGNLICLLFNHRHEIVQRFGYDQRRIRCKRCRKNFAMHDGHKTVIPWDGDFERIYSGLGYTIKEPLWGEPEQEPADA
jgi:hypothetical protein